MFTDSRAMENSPKCGCRTDRWWPSCVHSRYSICSVWFTPSLSQSVWKWRLLSFHGMATIVENILMTWNYWKVLIELFPSVTNFPAMTDGKRSICRLLVTWRPLHLSHSYLSSAIWGSEVKTTYRSERNGVATTRPVTRIYINRSIGERQTVLNNKKYLHMG